MPEVQGTTDFNGGAYPPSKTSPSYALTTLSIFRFGRTGTDRKFSLRGANTIAHHFNVVCGEGGAVCRGPRPTSSFGQGQNVKFHGLTVADGRCVVKVAALKAAKHLCLLLENLIGSRKYTISYPVNMQYILSKITMIVNDLSSVLTD